MHYVTVFSWFFRRGTLLELVCNNCNSFSVFFIRCARCCVCMSLALSLCHCTVGGCKRINGAGSAKVETSNTCHMRCHNECHLLLAHVQWRISFDLHRGEVGKDMKNVGALLFLNNSVSYCDNDFVLPVQSISQCNYDHIHIRSYLWFNKEKACRFHNLRTPVKDLKLHNWWS